MIELKITGSASEVHMELEALLAGMTKAPAGAVAVSHTAEPAETTTAPKGGKRGRKPAAEARQISDNPEDRREPEATDTPEVEQQDAADETAEKEQTETKKLTHDDVRNALGAYVKKFGMAAAQEDGPKVLRLALKDEKAGKISEIPDDQGKLKAVLDGILEMTEKNPFKRAEQKAA